jgi:type IV pilus assembly protein PilW
MKSRIIAAGAYGFTLLELMIAVALFAGISGAAYTIYGVQQRSYIRQDQVVEMQQNIRVFLYFLEKDIRMAGYDPKKTAGTGFLIAKPAEIAFTADLGRPRSPAVNCAGAGCDSLPDGAIISSPCSPATDCVAETIRYALKDDADSDGIAGSGFNPPKITTAVTKLFNGTVPSSSNPAQDVIDSVEGLEFLYNLSDGTAVTTVASALDMSRIRSVTVSMLIRARKQLMGYTNTQTYYPASNSNSTPKKWGPFKDRYIRRLVITNIQCRNMALQLED